VFAAAILNSVQEIHIILFISICISTENYALNFTYTLENTNEEPPWNFTLRLLMQPSFTRRRSTLRFLSGPSLTPRCITCVFSAVPPVYSAPYHSASSQQAAKFYSALYHSASSFEILLKVSVLSSLFWIFLPTSYRDDGSPASAWLTGPSSYSFFALCSCILAKPIIDVTTL
jgi:hypothetical protein